MGADTHEVSTAATIPAVQAGTILGGRYRLAKKIGVGGMATVWSARDEVLEREVAVKVANRSQQNTPGRRLRKEARTAARLRHHDIVDIYDYGEAPLHEDGTSVPYIVMELLAGRTLYDRLRAGRPAAAEAAAICVRVAAAVAAAHTAGVAHRDITLRNIMLTTEGVRVLDFGIAFTDGARSAGGSTLGTRGTLAPEVLAGAPANKPADVYALGIVLDTVLTPVDTSMADLVEECTAGDPSRRPTASEVAERLRARYPGADTWVWPAGQIRGRPRDPDPRAPEPPAVAPQAPVSPRRATALAPARAPHRRRNATRVAAGASTALLFLVAIGAVSTPRAPQEGTTAQPPLPHPSAPASTDEPPTDRETQAQATDQLADREPVGEPALGDLDHAVELIDEGESAGQIRADVALDLRQVIANMERDAETNGGSPDPGELAALRAKVEQRAEEGSLSPESAEELLEALSSPLS